MPQLISLRPGVVAAGLVIMAGAGACQEANPLYNQGADADTAAFGSDDPGSSPGSTALAAVGTGIRGDYYNSVDFSAFVFTRVDNKIDFDWGQASPGAGVDDERFSIRWTGQIQAAYSETYTFHTETDDGSRLWVNGVRIVDDWINNSIHESMGTIDLVAGHKYDLKMEFFDRTFYAVARLSWSSRSQAKQIVPTAYLYPPAP